MEPEIFGRGSWLFIFQMLFYYYNILDQGFNYLSNIKASHNIKNIENLENIEIDNTEIKKIFGSISKIQKLDLETSYNIFNNIIIEDLKKKIMTVISGLPCQQCKEHSLQNLNMNNIFNTTSFLYIFHFFIDFRNLFYLNKIDRKLINNFTDIGLQERNIIYNIIKTN